MSGTYSALVLEHFRHPLHHGRLADANASAEGANPLCGDRIRIECRVSDRTVVDASFSGDACAICVASASVLLDRVRSMSIAEVMLIGDAEVASSLGDLPAARRRCATLPLDTLHRALSPSAATSKVRPVILAAGAGRRFGGDKLDALVDGEPMIRGVVRAYASLCGAVTVVVRQAEQFAGALDGLPVTVAVNSDADEGIASSIRTAVSASSDRPAIMIALGDEPRVDRALVVAVMRRWETTGAPIVAPRFRGSIGHPVVFDRQCYADLLTLSGDLGARPLIRRMQDQVQFVDVDRALPADIDTTEDLRVLMPDLTSR